MIWDFDDHLYTSKRKFLNKILYSSKLYMSSLIFNKYWQIQNEFNMFLSKKNHWTDSIDDSTWFWSRLECCIHNSRFVLVMGLQSVLFWALRARRSMFKCVSASTSRFQLDCTNKYDCTFTAWHTSREGPALRMCPSQRRRRVLISPQYSGWLPVVPLVAPSSPWSEKSLSYCLH